MNEQKNNGRGIFYGVIGVATLVVAIIGATFAYFTATASNNVITGNMATVSLNLAVTKVTTVDVTKGGMIPMSNGMVEQAVNRGYTEKDDEDRDVTNICVDDNGNAVCQVYQITLTNSSSAGQFVDGYVALRGGSGAPTDLSLGDDEEYAYVAGAKKDAALAEVSYGTTMRWAQVFVDSSKNTNGATFYTTAGTQVLGTSTELVEFDAIGDASDPKDLADIRTVNALISANEAEGVLAPVSIAGTNYNVIGTNYIRLSNHAWGDGTAAESYDRTADITSALVFNHSIPAGGQGVYYIVVWLSETGTNQTAGATVGEITNPGAANFFVGDVTFSSAQGSEVSATFSGYTRVQSDKADV